MIINENIKHKLDGQFLGQYLDVLSILRIILVLLGCPTRDRESLSAHSIDCLCQADLTPWSFSLPFHWTILLFQLLWKGHVPWSCLGLTIRV